MPYVQSTSPMTARPFAALLATVLLAGCALHSDVYISPLAVPLANVERGNDPGSMLRKADYVHLVDYAPTVEARKHSAQELLAIGSAEVISGRYDAARRHLRADRKSVV